MDAGIGKASITQEEEALAKIHTSCVRRPVLTSGNEAGWKTGFREQGKRSRVMWEGVIAFAGKDQSNDPRCIGDLEMAGTNANAH